MDAKSVHRGIVIVPTDELKRENKKELEEAEDFSDNQDYNKPVKLLESSGIKLNNIDFSSDEEWSDDIKDKGPIGTGVLNLINESLVNNNDENSSNEQNQLEKQLEKIEKQEKKQKKKKKKSKPKSIGRTIKQGDKSYELMFAMLLGIRTSLSNLSSKKLPNNKFTSKEYKEVENYFFPSSGTANTPAHTGRDFRFKDYAPLVFQDLRNKSGIDSVDYLISLTKDYKLSEICSPGKSGSFFYFSRDTLYMLKTVKPSEKKFLQKIMRAYHNHVSKFSDTLLIRFYGFHMVQPHGGQKMHFVVMGNIFAQSLEIHERYDLKGSTVNRTVGEEALKNAKPTMILKDLDLKRCLLLGPEKREIFFHQLERDSEFLEKQDIMDYSLLLGIHYKNRVPKSDDDSSSEEQEIKATTYYTRDHGGFGATDDDNQPLSEIYFLGIIDILQPYDITKQVEHSWKSGVMRLNRYEISAVSPTVYADRFLRFIKSHVTGGEDCLSPRTYSQLHQDNSIKLKNNSHSFTHAIKFNKRGQPRGVERTKRPFFKRRKGGEIPVEESLEVREGTSIEKSAPESNPVITEPSNQKNNDSSGSISAVHVEIKAEIKVEKKDDAIKLVKKEEIKLEIQQNIEKVENKAVKAEKKEEKKEKKEEKKEEKEEKKEGKEEKKEEGKPPVQYLNTKEKKKKEEVKKEKHKKEGQPPMQYLNTKERRDRKVRKAQKKENKDEPKVENLEKVEVKEESKARKDEDEIKKKRKNQTTKEVPPINQELVLPLSVPPEPTDSHSSSETPSSLDSPVIEVEDKSEFDVRVPKRKRVVEKSIFLQENM